MTQNETQKLVEAVEALEEVSGWVRRRDVIALIEAACTRAVEVKGDVELLVKTSFMEGFTGGQNDVQGNPMPLNGPNYYWQKSKSYAALSAIEQHAPIDEDELRDGLCEAVGHDLVRFGVQNDDAPWDVAETVLRYLRPYLLKK